MTRCPSCGQDNSDVKGATELADRLYAEAWHGAGGGCSRPPLRGDREHR